MTKRTWSGLFAVLVVLSMLVACGPSQPAAEPTKAPEPTQASTQPTTAATEPTKAPEPTQAPAASSDQPLVVAINADVNTFEPDEISSRTDSNVAEHLFDRLVEMDENHHLQPMLATSWKLLDDHKTWQFKLRQDVKFQDGEPFNAETVKYVFERAADPANKFVGNTPGYDFESIGYDHVDVVDDYTVNIVLKGFQPDAPGYISEILIHPIKYYKENSLEKVAEAPLGSGPYKLVEWVRDDHLTLERWDDYWGPKPAIKTIIFRVIPEASTRVAELLAGNVQVISQVPPDQADQIDKSGTAHMEIVTGGRRIYIGFQQKCDGPGCKEVRDVRVRQALNYAVDVDSILKGLFGGRGEREGGMVNPPHKSPDIKPYPYDPEKAKQLLAEAGYPNGFKCTLATPNGRYQKDKEIALAVAADLAKVGVQAEVVPYDWSVYSKMAQHKELPALFLLGCGSTFLSAWYDLSLLVNKDSPTNYAGWHNDEWDQLVAKLNTTYDEAERKKITDQMQVLVHNDPPWLFIYMQLDWYAVSNKVDWKPRADEIMDFTTAKWK